MRTDRSQYDAQIAPLGHHQDLVHAVERFDDRVRLTAAKMMGALQGEPLVVRIEALCGRDEAVLRRQDAYTVAELRR
jgi:hypothetical protein